MNKRERGRGEKDSRDMTLCGILRGSLIGVTTKKINNSLKLVLHFENG